MNSHKIVLKDVSKRLRAASIREWNEQPIHASLELEAAQYIECLELALEMYLEDIKKLRDRLK